jgi:sRNA-binding regulator protein Hfq
VGPHVIEKTLMPPTSDPKTADGNIQDVFLNHVRREKLTVTGADHMIFKHAIAVIRTPRPIANHFPAP